MSLSGPEGALTQLYGDISRRAPRVRGELLRHTAWVQILASFRTEHAILGTTLKSISFSYFINAMRVIVLIVLTSKGCYQNEMR